MARGLTERQKEVFDFICASIRRTSCPPTVREIADHFRFRSPKAASDHLAALERKGYIVRTTGKARNISVRKELSPQGIPLVGRMAAGPRLLALENLQGSLSTAALFEADENTFALQMKGDSMKDAGILEGDYLIVASGQAVRDGSIAAVQIAEEATVRRVFFEDALVRLVCENPDFEDIALGKQAAGFRIIGPVKGVIRKL